MLADPRRAPSPGPDVLSPDAEDCRRLRQELIEIDNHGERLVGCLTCNLWTAGLARKTCALCTSYDMSDRIKLGREIAARTEPRFIEIKTEPRRKATFIEIPRQRGGARVPFTEAELIAMRGGLTAEEYRWKLIRKWTKRK